MGDRYISQLHFTQRDRWRKNYCLTKSGVNIALLRKSYELSIVVDGTASRHWLNGRSFAFSEPIRDDCGREENLEKGMGSMGMGEKRQTIKVR